MASSWLNFSTKKTKKKHSKKLSQLRHVELANECESIKTNTYDVLAGLMTGNRAGSRACSWLNFFNVFFFVEKIEPATRR